jgi:hypothetical protein
VEDRRLHAHKVILASASKLFCRLLNISDASDPLPVIPADYVNAGKVRSRFLG